jgi:lipoprotein-anchoring transpeptidase ErfK/SrfK
MKKMHYSKKYDNAPMPDSIFFHGGYAIHATEAINKLGRPASHGCVRLHPQDANWLYYIVQEYGMENTFIWIKD